MSQGEDELKKILTEIEKNYPNNGDLGREIRKLIKELCYTK